MSLGHRILFGHVSPRRLRHHPEFVEPHHRVVAHFQLEPRLLLQLPQEVRLLLHEIQRDFGMQPYRELALLVVRARSRPKCARSSCSTLSRLPRDSMSMKSTTMIPPMSRSRSWRATSRAASMFVFRMVLSGSFFPV